MTMSADREIVKDVIKHVENQGKAEEEIKSELNSKNEKWKNDVAQTIVEGNLRKARRNEEFKAYQEKRNTDD